MAANFIPKLAYLLKLENPMKALALTSPNLLALLLSGLVNLALFGAISASSAPHTAAGERVFELPSVTVVGKRLPPEEGSSTLAQAPQAAAALVRAKL